MKTINENEAPKGFKAILNEPDNHYGCNRCCFTEDNSISCYLEEKSEFKLGMCSSQDRADDCDVYFVKI